MKTAKYFWVGLSLGITATAGLAWTQSAVADDGPSVVINELAWAGSTKSSTDEWLELKNISQADVDVSGWQFTKNTGSESLMLTIPADKHIPAGGYFIIANFDAANSVLAIDPNVVDTAITLSNDKLQIKLYRGDWSNPANLVDTAGDGGTPPAGNNTAKSSMERNGDGTGWHDAMAAVNLDAGVSDLGTPGAENSQITEPPVVESVTPSTAPTDTHMTLESITGNNFSVDPMPRVELKLNGQSITADTVHAASPMLIDGGEFNLDGAAVGKWDLVVTNPDGQSATLPQAIEVTEPPKQHDLTTTVRLNELYPQPNTTSNDEFIELYNFGDKTVDLTDWVVDDIRDGGSSPFTFGAQNILPKSYLVIYKSESKITLNDSGDDAYLIQPNGFELDHTNYQSAPRGQTWARFDDGWKWTNSPTPNGKNVLSSPPPPPQNPIPINEPDDTSTVPATFTKGDILITELLPNPKDNDEFIELYNNASKPIELKGWVLQDKSKHKYKIDDFAVNIQTANTLTIQPGQYVVVTKTMSGIALNNTGGETVTLSDPAGDVIATVSYPDKAPASAAYAWDGKIWTWSPHPTPGQVNILALDEADEQAPAVEVIAPDTLPVTGGATRWWGILLASLALTAMVWWSYAGSDHS